MMVHIKLEKATSNTTYHKRSRNMQKFWWISVDGKRGYHGFVKFEGNFRSDDKFNIELDLPPGIYVAGAGPAEWGTRFKFEITEDGQARIIQYMCRGRYIEPAPSEGVTVI